MIVMQRLGQALDVASRLGALAGSLLCFAMMMLITVDVALRATLNVAIAGTIELSEFGLVLMTFFAQAWAYAEGRHIAIDFFMQGVRRRTADLLELAMTVPSLAFIVLMACATIDSGLEMVEGQEITDALGLPKGWFKMAAGVGLLLLALAMLRRLILLAISTRKMA